MEGARRAAMRRIVSAKGRSRVEVRGVFTGRWPPKGRLADGSCVVIECDRCPRHRPVLSSSPKLDCKAMKSIEKLSGQALKDAGSIK